MVYQEIDWPSFVAKITPDSTRQLKIPRNFFNGMAVSAETILRRNSRRSGRCWLVKMVTNDEGDLMFQEGWDEFVEDYPLELGDYFYFKYHGNSKFGFTVFGTDGCEKEMGTFNGNEIDDSD
ncbi:hypothetical protein MKW92_040845 [Papaver armeniacum]|nr:hypothetical protein MKW92_037800 [Papaver armeniacum]KAI3944994.1 hypothetical protein MKW92_040845 [Papaver armeniacum]